MLDPLAWVWQLTCCNLAPGQESRLISPRVDKTISILLHILSLHQ